MLGAGFSVLQGVEALLGQSSAGGVLLALSVLGVALLLDGSSWVRAVWQLRGEAAERGTTVREHLLAHAEPTVRAVFFEDTAAVLGVLLAAAGITLDALTGNQVWDAIASLLIGALLVAVAFVLGAQNRTFLIGRSAGCWS